MKSYTGFVAIIAVLALAAPAFGQVQFDSFRRAAEQMRGEAARLMQEKAIAEDTLKHADVKAEEAHREAVQKASPAEKAAVADATNQIAEAKAVIDKTATVAADQTKSLMGNLATFYAENSSAAKRYDSAVTAIAISGISLSLAAAIAGFLRLSKAAGIASLVVTAVLAVPKTLPIEDKAKYYRVLSVQSYALLLETRLARNETPETYDDQVRRFTVLVKYGAEKYPNSSNVVETTADLIKELSKANKITPPADGTK